MRKITIEVSVREASRAFMAIDDNRYFRELLNQEASNYWTYEYDGYDEEEREDAEQLIYDIEDLFNRAGISNDEYTIEVM